MTEQKLAAKPNNLGKTLFLITGIMFILYGGFLIWFLLPQVNARVHSLVSVVLVAAGIIVEGFVIISQARQAAPIFLSMGIIFVVINIAGLVLFSIRWTLCWPFIIGIVLSAAYIMGGLIKKKTAASAASQEQMQA
jgi:thiol:disulfide interchange protein